MNAGGFAGLFVLVFVGICIAVWVSPPFGKFALSDA